MLLARAMVFKLTVNRFFSCETWMRAIMRDIRLVSALRFSWLLVHTPHGDEINASTAAINWSGLNGFIRTATLPDVSGKLSFP